MNYYIEFKKKFVETQSKVVKVGYAQWLWLSNWNNNATCYFDDPTSTRFLIQLYNSVDDCFGIWIVENGFINNEEEMKIHLKYIGLDRMKMGSKITSLNNYLVLWERYDYENKKEKDIIYYVDIYKNEIIKKDRINRGIRGLDTVPETNDLIITSGASLCWLHFDKNKKEIIEIEMQIFKELEGKVNMFKIENNYLIISLDYQYKRTILFKLDDIRRNLNKNETIMSIVIDKEGSCGAASCCISSGKKYFIVMWFYELCVYKLNNDDSSSFEQISCLYLGTTDIYYMRASDKYISGIYGSKLITFEIIDNGN